MKIRFDCPECGGDVDITPQGISYGQIVQCTFCREHILPKFDDVVRVEPAKCFVMGVADED